MFIKMKSLAWSSVGLVLSAATAYAAAPPPAPINSNFFLVTIPNLKPAIEFNAGVLWLKPGASNLNYVINNKELPVQSPGWNEQELKPSFTPAFEVGLRYAFPQAAGSDVNLNWTHLNTSDSSSISAANANFFLGPDYEIGPEGLVIRQANGNAKFKYDVVNLDVGQFVNFGQFVQMRFFGGLSGGVLKEEVTATYAGSTGLPFSGPFSMMQDSTSNFYGVGPRFGMHGEINTRSGFGFLGEVGLSALIGYVDSKTDFTGSAQELIDIYGQAVNYQHIKDQSVYQVVPGLDTKLGVKYQCIFYRDMLLTLSAGYQAAVYMNAISQYQPASLVSGDGLETGGIFVATMSHRLSNYSVQGPFLDFSIRF